MPPALLYYAIPFFVLLLIAEAIFSAYEKRHLYLGKDTFTSLALGIGNVLTGLITKALIFGALMLAYRYRFFTLDSSAWWVWLLAFFADDFSYYWFHRISHHVNWFWASHVVHHSSQYYNLSAALRQTWTGNIAGSFIFWLWMPLVGFHPIIVMTMQSVSLIYQFWIHTEVVHKLPAWAELIFNTPSHHRVHHGTDLEYLDRNHGGILIIWDRLFGTFQPELQRPKYGLTKDISSYNPFIVAFVTWADLIKKARQAGSLKNALNYFLKPPGWSHDGSSLTTRQLIDKYNREHPGSPVGRS